MSEQHTVLFDRDCGICQWAMEWVGRLDRKKRFTCIPYQDADLAAFAPALTAERCAVEMVVVSATGEVCGGGDAVRFISRRLPLMNLVWPFMEAPGLRQAVDRGYRWIAENRLRLSVKMGRKACPRPLDKE